MNARFASRMAEVRPSAIRALMKLSSDPRIISFGGGYPDPTIFPKLELAKIFYSVIVENGETALQYAEASGLPRLREQIAGIMCDDGTLSDAANIIILHGAQQGLDLVGKLFLDRGDLVVTERPTFLGAMIAFNPYQPRYIDIPIDSDGIDIASLESLLQREVPKFVYTVPDFQNPSGCTMSETRRRRLVELANIHGFYIIEDSPYRGLRYAGVQMPTLRSLDTHGRVVYIGSFSKTLAPGLRLGWADAPVEIIDRLSLLKLASDTQCSTLTMAVVSRFLETCDLSEHVAMIRRAYLRKKSVMLEAISRSFPKDIDFTDPAGGLFTWLTFPAGIDTAHLMAERVLPEVGVAYVPGAAFFATTPEHNHARFSFATQSDEAIVAGITALGRLLRS